MWFDSDLCTCISCHCFQVTEAPLLGLQASVSQLIYRYLASEEGTESADRKTRLLLSLVQHIHTAAYIMQYRTRRQQLRITTSCTQIIRLLNNQENAFTDTSTTESSHVGRQTDMYKP